MFLKKIKAKTLIEICWINMNLKKDLKISIYISLYHIILIFFWYGKKWLLILTQWIPNDQFSMVLMSELYCVLKIKTIWVTLIKTLIATSWISMNLKKDFKISINNNLYYVILILIWYGKKWHLILTQWISNDQSCMVLMSRLEFDSH